MNPWIERATIAAAYLFAAVYLVGAGRLGMPEARRTKPVTGPAAYFHGGKTAGTPVLDTGCQSPECHEAYPHKKDRTESAFRNMHQNLADCLACHGKEPEKRWVGGVSGESRKLRYSREASAGNPHADLGQAAPCRKCHSEPGRERLRERGMAFLPPGHADPIALRMVEGGPKRWAPADLR